MSSFEEEIKRRLTRHEIRDQKDYKNEIREITQNIILSALRNTKFFDNAVFMGGTALRMLYGLNRYSEDLDFNFINKNPNFKWETYYNDIKKYGEKYNCNFLFKEENNNRNTKTVIIKDENLGIKIKEMNIVNTEYTKKKAGNYRKVNVSLDGSYQEGKFTFEEKRINFPDNISIKVFNLESLYGGKINAILTRRDKYGNDVDEGRDWFDLNWFTKQNIAPNYEYLFDKLEKHPNFKENKVVRTIDWLKKQLYKRAEKLNLSKLNEDIFQLTTSENYIELDLKKVKNIINNIENKNAWGGDVVINNLNKNVNNNIRLNIVDNKIESMLCFKCDNFDNEGIENKLKDTKIEKLDSFKFNNNEIVEKYKYINNREKDIYVLQNKIFFDKNNYTAKVFHFYKDFNNISAVNFLDQYKEMFKNQSIQNIKTKNKDNDDSNSGGGR